MEDFFRLSDYYYFLRLDDKSNIICSNAHLENSCPFIEKPMRGLSFSEILYFKDFSTYEYYFEKSLSVGDRKFALELRKVNKAPEDLVWTKWEFSISTGADGKYFLDAVGHVMQEKKEKSIPLSNGVDGIDPKHELMEGILNDTLIGFWSWDISRNTEELSLSLTEMLGFPIHSGDAKPIRWRRHIHPSDRASVEKSLSQHFGSSGKIPFHCEFRIRDRYKKNIWVLGYGRVLRWEAGDEPAWMVGCFFDISEKKKTENLLKHQQRLLQTVSFNQSHLMRAKLANILGILEIIDPKSDPSENAHFLKMIRKEAKKLDEYLKRSISNTNDLPLQTIDESPY